MSQRNVEIVRRGYEAYARGDIPGMLEYAHPDQITYRAEPDGATLDMFASKAQAFEAAGLSE